MGEEVKTTTQPQEPANNPQEPANTQEDYIKALADLKANSVSKEQYNKLKEDNQKLLQAIINGEKIEIDPAESKDIKTLRNELFNSEQPLSNLEYATKALELRSKLISEGKQDPFLPVGHQVTITNEDIEAAERVAECLQACIDYAAGDSTIFTNELQRIMKDAAPARGTKRK